MAAGRVLQTTEATKATKYRNSTGCTITRMKKNVCTSMFPNHQKEEDIEEEEFFYKYDDVDDFDVEPLSDAFGSSTFGSTINHVDEESYNQEFDCWDTTATTFPGMMNGIHQKEQFSIAAGARGRSSGWWPSLPSWLQVPPLGQ